jgi:hypothetical protein
MLRGAMSRTWIRVVLINLAIFLAGIVIVELIFGNWIFGPHLGYLTITRDVVIHRDLNPVDPGAGIGTYTRDRLGLRGDYGGDPANIDMLVMGGSTTNELYVSDEKTWVAQLDKLLAEGGYKLKAVNAGVDGHSSIANIRSFQVWLPEIPRLHPKYFMFYIGINEPIADALEGYELLEEKHFWPKVIRTFKNNSAINNLYRIVRGYIRARQVRIVHERDDLTLKRMVAHGTLDAEREKRVGATWKPQLVAYEARAHKLAQLVHEWHATPIFVTQLRGDYRLNGDEVVGLHEGSIDQAMIQRLFNDVTLRVCREEKGICIDLEREIKIEDGDFYDSAHVVASGSRKVAEVIYKDLAPHLQKAK